MRKFIKDVVKDNMDYMESVYRDVMVDNVAGSWDKMEELEAQESLEFDWTDRGHLIISLTFNPIFNRSVVKVYWWKDPIHWSIICLRYKGRWDMTVARQGEESMAEEICEELMEEANR